MFHLYVQSIKKGWTDEDEELKKGKLISDDLDELELLAEKLTPKKYLEYMIVEHRKDGDRTVRRQELYQECIVEYSDDVKVNFEVKAIEFKPSKMKQKEELRKMTEEYLK